MYQYRLKSKYLLMVLAAIASLLIFAAGYAPAEEDSETITADIAEEQVKLEGMKTDIAMLDLEIAKREQNLDQNRQQLADTRILLSDAESAYNDTLKLYEQRITSIYKMGKGQFYAVVLSSEGINDAATRLSYMLEISENDRKLVARVKADAEKVRRLHQQVDILKQESAEGLDELRVQRAEMAGEIDVHQRQLDEKSSHLAEVEAQEMAIEAAQSNTGDFGSLFDSLTTPALVTVSNVPPEGLEPSGVVLSGVASWYGPGFHGETTASGEIYDMYAYTAAHKSLPFNTWLRVTYSGRSVFVRINDRGPYIGDRFLDLSASAARSIGMTGVGFVTAEIYR